MYCRNCKNLVNDIFVDLITAPPSNSYLSIDELSKKEIYYPLKIFVCDSCWLVQTEDYTSSDELFTNEYAYFSSTSSSWLIHAQIFSKKIIDELKLCSNSYVIEIASNDGYLLKNFKNINIPCLGIEPTKSTADEAEKIGIPVLRKFFGSEVANHLAKENKHADLIIGNNVYAHVPDINDFTSGMKRILKPTGTITLEFPHLLSLIKLHQFDTIYHEHYSYLSLGVVSRIFKSHDLKIYKVENLSTHGGSLRIFGCHEQDSRKKEDSVDLILENEKILGMENINVYTKFQRQVDEIKYNFIDFLIKAKRMNKRVAAYGAAAKGNTFMNYAGVKNDLISYVCDASLSKQGKFMPGNRLQIMPPEYLKSDKPDYVIVFPWNIIDEIIIEHSYIREWGGKFVTATPEIRII